MATVLRRHYWATRYAGSIFAAPLFILVASAAASDITYNIVDYPLNEANLSSDGTLLGTDTISGTIITDGTIGPISAANIVGGTFSFSVPGGNWTGTASFGDPIGLQATSTQLLLTSGTDSSFSIGTGALSVGVGVTYKNYPGDGEYYGFASTGANILYPFGLGPTYYGQGPTPLSTGPGSIAANPSWVIATVPEPSTITLLLSAAAAIAVAVLPRRAGSREGGWAARDNRDEPRGERLQTGFCRSLQ